MSTLQTTISMLEVMPEEDVKAIHDITYRIFQKDNNPFKLLSRDQGFNDLEESRNQINNGQCMELGEALSLYSIVEDENKIEHIESLASSPDLEMHSHDDRITLNDEEQFYIVWDEVSLPIVLCLGKYINKCWDDVMAVAFDTYFVSELTRKVIGIRH